MEFELINKYKMEINKDFRKYADSTLKEYGVTIANLKCLLVIERSEDINLNEIAIQLNVDKAMVTRSIKKLVELGYVNKIQDKKDTRSYKISLSEEGEETLNSLRGIFKDWFDKVTHNFTEEEKDLYVTLMRRVHQNRIYKA